MHRISIITVINIIIKESETLILCIHLKLFTLWLLFFFWVDALVWVCHMAFVSYVCVYAFGCLLCYGQVFIIFSSFLIHIFTLYKCGSVPMTQTQIQLQTESTLFIWPSLCELCYAHEFFVIDISTHWYIYP